MQAMMQCCATNVVLNQHKVLLVELSDDPRFDPDHPRDAAVIKARFAFLQPC